MVAVVPSRIASARRLGLATALACSPLAAVAALIAWRGHWGPDWPAQEFRAWSAAHDGLTAWTNEWYSGVALPGYSVIYPVVGGVLGAALTGALAVLAAWVGAAGFAPSASRTIRLCFHVSVGVVLGADLLIGQIPYLLGAAFGVWALRAMAGRHPYPAAAAAAACSLASPLSGALLLVAVPAFVVAVGLRRAAPLLAGAAGLLVSAIFEGAGGRFPFGWRVLVWIALFVVLALVLTARADRPVKVFAATYALATVAALAVANPVGGNIARFGQLVALPLFWYVYPRLRWRHWTVALLVSALGVLWTTWPALSSMGRGATDPSRDHSYYAGLLAFLHEHDRATGRLEVVFTREHWESLYVAQAYPIARGWERQTDLGSNAVLYHPITAAAYEQWLRDNAVSYVALPDVPIDYGGRAETALLRNPPAYLVPAWHDRHWQVWRVRDAQPVVTGPATLHAVGAASFVIDFRRRGTAVVRLRASRMWTATAGEACVGTSGKWLTVSAPHAGRVTVRSRLHLAQLGPATARRCS